VVFSQFFWPAALQQLTGLLADGTWVPMATVHFAAVTGALLAGLRRLIPRYSSGLLPGSVGNAE
jgi:hypothetical protein